MTNPPELTPARKAAILISTLDVESADRLLEQLPSDLANQVREMALALEDVSPADRDTVIKEFFAAGGRGKIATNSPQESSPAESGVELQLSSQVEDIQQASQDTGVSSESRPQSNKAPEVAPRFEILHQADTSSLSELLRNEHPQILAVIVAHLPRDRAARLLAEFPQARRADVARRIKQMEEMHPDILRELEQGLATRFTDLGLDSQGSVKGHVILDEILAAAEPQVREHLQSSLNLNRNIPKPTAAARESVRPQQGSPAARIPEQKLPLTFADVQRLSGDALFQVFTTVSPEEAILALFDAPEPFVARVLDQLSPREARVWRYALAHPGPTRLSDVIAAQARIAFAAEELATANRIDLPFQHMALVA